MEAWGRHDIGVQSVKRLGAEGYVRYLEEWMEAHLSESIGIEDLAAAVRLAPRSVQYAFRRHRGCTPMQALLARRLERARLELLRAEPVSTVTEVATLCGFYHLSRFARRYRERFGEPPSVTLGKDHSSMTEPADGDIVKSATASLGR